MSRPVLRDFKSIDKYKDVYRVEAGNRDIFICQMGDSFQVGWHYVLAAKGEQLYALLADPQNEDFIWDYENPSFG